MVLFLLSLPLADFDGHMDWDGGWGVLMVLGMVLFWALAIGGIIWLLRELGSSRPSHSKPDDDPLRTLDRRLADGSLSPDDYRERRAILSDEDAHSER